MTELESYIREARDRQQIWDCLLRYTRGVDRLDRESLLSAYHADAIDDHGAFVGGPEAFCDWVLPFHGQNQTVTHHTLHNHYCELTGDVAHAETYYSYYAANTDGTVTYAIGRYIDRLERRNGRWAIAERVCLTEGMNDLPKSSGDPAFLAALQSNGPATRDRNDPSYH